MTLKIYSSAEKSLARIQEWFNETYGLNISRTDAATAALHRVREVPVTTTQLVTRHVKLFDGKSIILNEIYRPVLESTMYALPSFIKSLSWALNIIVIQFALSLPASRIVEERKEVQIRVKKRGTARSPFMLRYIN
jgi:hypothetical protein